MHDSMDAFYSHLGASAELGDQPIDGCGCNVSEPELGAVSVAVDAALAMGKVIEQYVAVTAQGEALRRIVVAGVQVPCEVWTAYANARQEYTTKSQQLFDQLTPRASRSSK